MMKLFSAMEYLSRKALVTDLLRLVTPDRDAQQGVMTLAYYTRF
jgi:hypothetical protein